MRIRSRYIAVVALAVAGALAIAGIALASATSTFTFRAIPNKAPKHKFKGGALKTDLKTAYTNPGNQNPGGAVDRTQLYFDKDFRVNPKAAPKCSPTQVEGTITMQQAMQACRSALVGKGRAAATTGTFTVPGCVLLFNGKPKGKKPTLVIFTRLEAAPPPNNTIDCSNPASNTHGNTNVLLNGVYKGASGKYGEVLDVTHITQSAALPLVDYRTKVKRGDYASARCAAKNKTWDMKVIWTYNDGTKTTVHKTQKCRVQH